MVIFQLHVMMCVFCNYVYNELYRQCEMLMQSFAWAFMAGLMLQAPVPVGAPRALQLTFVLLVISPVFVISVANVPLL